jgi:hypothetical protein
MPRAEPAEPQNTQALESGEPRRQDLRGTSHLR